MPITVSSAFNSQNSMPILLYRRDTGRYEDGIWIEGKIKPIKALASVQMPDQETIKMLTGLERVAGAKVFWINRRVDSPDYFRKDDSVHFKYDGLEYRAMTNAEWTPYGYSKVVAKVAG